MNRVTLSESGYQTKACRSSWIKSDVADHRHHRFSFSPVYSSRYKKSSMLVDARIETTSTVSSAEGGRGENWYNIRASEPAVVHAIRDTNGFSGACDDQTSPHTILVMGRRHIVATMIGSMHVLGQPHQAKASSSGSLSKRFRSDEQGFSFSYPESFVVAFDRTKDIMGGERALVSVGDFRKFITVTVFGSHRVKADQGDMLDVDTGYDMCIRPIVESDTTMGFRVVREEILVNAVTGVRMFDFEYDHAVCRGETIESSGGILRCIVRVHLMFMFMLTGFCCLCQRLFDGSLGVHVWGYIMYDLM